ncbi:uncharacterized protein LOC144676351 [Cetorhinus maximus]
MEQDTDYMNMRHIKNNTTDPSERKTGQETAGGRSSITSTHLGIACFIVLIISLAIAIGLRVQVLQMDKNMTGLNGKIQNMSETLEKTRRNLRSICTVLRNCSESLCPSGWKVHNHHCYRLSMESKEWNSAKLQCESQNSHLIIINTEQEQMDKNMTGLNGKIQNMSETLEKMLRNLRSLCTVLRNCSGELALNGPPPAPM